MENEWFKTYLCMHVLALVGVGRDELAVAIRVLIHHLTLVLSLSALQPYYPIHFEINAKVLVNFFFNAKAHDFPLYSEALKFFKNEDQMVRIAVRTLTLTAGGSAAGGVVGGLGFLGEFRRRSQRAGRGGGAAGRGRQEARGRRCSCSRTCARRS